MENTLENKAKFFAQFLGQHVLYFSSDFLRKIDNLTLDSVENDDFLELKPLSQISDEDVIQGITYLYNITREALVEILEIEQYDTFSSITTIIKFIKNSHQPGVSVWLKNSNYFFFQ